MITKFGLIFFFALQADRDTLVHTFCGGVHIPAVLMLQAQREQQLCRYDSSVFHRGIIHRCFVSV